MMTTVDFCSNLLRKISLPLCLNRRPNSICNDLVQKYVCQIVLYQAIFSRTGSKKTFVCVDG